MNSLLLVSRVTLAKVMFSFNNAPLDSNMLLKTKKKKKKDSKSTFWESFCPITSQVLLFIYFVKQGPCFPKLLGSVPDGSWNGTIWSARSAVPPHLS